MSAKLDIFTVLHHLDLKNIELFDMLSESEQKQTVPFVIMKWLSGCNDASQVVLLNEFVNQYCFSLGKEKDLLLKLMTVCTSGKKKRYKWIKSKTQLSANGKLRLIKEYYGYTTSQAQDAANLLHDEDFIAIGKELGYDDKEIERMLKNN